jgi:hypothetical protein
VVSRVKIVKTRETKTWWARSYEKFQSQTVADTRGETRDRYRSIKLEESSMMMIRVLACMKLFLPVKIAKERNQWKLPFTFANLPGGLIGLRIGSLVL